MIQSVFYYKGDVPYINLCHTLINFTRINLSMYYIESYRILPLLLDTLLLYGKKQHFIHTLTSLHMRKCYMYSGIRNKAKLVLLKINVADILLLIKYLSLLPGILIIENIVRNMDRCSAVLAVITEDFLNDPMNIVQLRYAKESGIPFIILLQKGAHIPKMIQNMKTISFTNEILQSTMEKIVLEINKTRYGIVLFIQYTTRNYMYNCMFSKCYLSNVPYAS